MFVLNGHQAWPHGPISFFRSCHVAAFTCCLVFWFWPAAGHCQTRPEFNPRKALDKPVRPIVNPQIVAIGKTTIPMRDDELVLGVVVQGQARAYPINMLTGPSREIINDHLGDRDIAATW